MATIKQKTSTDILIEFTKEFQTRDWAESVGISDRKIAVYIKDKKKLPSGLVTSYQGYPVEIIVSGKYRP